MRVSSSRRSRRSSSSSTILPTIGAVLAILCVFYLAVKWFRSDTTPVQEEVAVATDVVPTAVAPEGFVPEAALFGPDASGTAHRSVSGGIYSIALRADLPEIDRTALHYEGWLLEQSPYHFFSLGEMITDETGTFILNWEGKQGENYLEYAEVIVTREVNDTNPDPSTHVLKGVFE